MTAPTKKFNEMTDKEFTEALRSIITTSGSVGEVHQRVADELGYPYVLSIDTLARDREPSMLAGLLGGLRLTNGDIAMVLADGPSGDSIQL